MENEWSVKLRNHLQENFPHFLRLWGRDAWEDFIAVRSHDALLTHLMTDEDTPLGGDPESILFRGLSVSPYHYVADVIQKNFPVFNQKLAGHDAGIKLNILIDLTVFCFPYSNKQPLSLASQAPDLNESAVACAVGRYLHRYL